MDYRDELMQAGHLGRPNPGIGRFGDVAAHDERRVTEVAAKAIYRIFDGSDAHPWVEGGNSNKQEDARRYARAALWAVTGIPERDITKAPEKQGLFRKFEVRRLDGSDHPGEKHYGCRYFVLDLSHDKHAPAAMRAYAASCSATHPALAADIRAEFGESQPKRCQE